MGFVGTWVGQALIASIGLLRTGVCALLLQAGSLALAAVIYRYSHVMTLTCNQALYSSLQKLCIKHCTRL